VATLPLFGLNLKPTEILSGATKVVYFEKAIPFLYDNSLPAQSILLRTRFACILFPLILAVLLFLCCLEMFGQKAALLGAEPCRRDWRIIMPGRFLLRRRF
jgi:hypothetical protein